MIEDFRKAVKGRYQAIEQNRAPGQKVIGWMCTYTPEEIIHAAGMYPVRVFGGSEATSTADAYLHIDMCSFVRSCLEEAFQGRYDFLDGFVTPNSCDNIRRLYDVWSHYRETPFTHIISLPHKVTEASLGYFRDELVRFKTHLEEWSGTRITEDDLRQAIAAYNRTRTLLKRLDDLRKDGSPPLSGAEFLDVVLAGMVLPREKYNQMLEQLLSQLPRRGDAPTNEKLRVLLAGSELYDSQFIQVIEESGALVVADDLCTGSRHFWNLTETDGDPLAALARRYLTRPDCPRMYPSTRRVEHLKELVQSRQARGVILEVIKFCKLHDEGSIAVRVAMEEIGIPVLTLSREHGLAGIGQLRTRVEAFCEMFELA